MGFLVAVKNQGKFQDLRKFIKQTLQPGPFVREYLCFLDRFYVDNPDFFVGLDQLHRKNAKSFTSKAASGFASIIDLLSSIDPTGDKGTEEDSELLIEKVAGPAKEGEPKATDPLPDNAGTAAEVKKRKEAKKRKERAAKKKLEKEQNKDEDVKVKQKKPALKKPKPKVKSKRTPIKISAKQEESKETKPVKEVPITVNPAVVISSDTKEEIEEKVITTTKEVLEIAKNSLPQSVKSKEEIKKDKPKESGKDTLIRWSEEAKRLGREPKKQVPKTDNLEPKAEDQFLTSAAKWLRAFDKAAKKTDLIEVIAKTLEEMNKELSR